MRARGTCICGHQPYRPAHAGTRHTACAVPGSRPRRRPSLTLSAVAHDSGYYDHAHFVRDCQDIAGEAPGVVLGRSDDVTTVFLDGATR